MPVLYLIAGPNGTGKTTFYSIALQNGFIEKNLPFINVDIIAQKLGGIRKRPMSEHQRFIVKLLDSI
jgi:predicted ABC-type ATPase